MKRCCLSSSYAGQLNIKCNSFSVRFKLQHLHIRRSGCNFGLMCLPVSIARLCMLVRSLAMALVICLVSEHFKYLSIE